MSGMTCHAPVGSPSAVTRRGRRRGLARDRDLTRIPVQGFQDPFPAPMPCSTSRSSAILPPRSRKASASPALMSVRSRHPEAEALCFERGSTGLCFAWAIRSRVLGMGEEAGRCFLCRCSGSAPHLGAACPSFKSGGREVVASPPGAEGRCFACRCRGALHRIVRQQVPASNPEA